MAKSIITCLSGSSKVQKIIFVAAGVGAAGLVLALGLRYVIQHYREPSKSNSDLRILMLVNQQ